MASTFTDSLRLEQQGQGENNNTWGIILNSTIAAIDQAIAGSVAVTLSSGDYVLSALNNEVDEARAKILVLNGSLTGNAVVQVPVEPKEYLLVDNTTRNGFTIDLRLGAAGSTVSVVSGVFGSAFTDASTWFSSAVQNDGRFTQRANNLSDLNSASAARGNLGLGTAATQADDRYAHRANNLSDLANAATARTNLGLGTAAVEADTKYAHRANNLSDLANAATARTNLGLGTAAVEADTKYAHRANNLSDLANVATARTNLSVLEAGTADGQAQTNAQNDTDFLIDSAQWAQNSGFIQSAIVNLDNSFDTSEQIKVSRVGDQVMIKSLGTLTHNDTTAPSSSTAIVPSWARPDTPAVQHYGFDALAQYHAYIRVTVDGTIGTIYRNGDLSAGVSRTDTGDSFTICYPLGA